MPLVSDPGAQRRNAVRQRVAVMPRLAQVIYSGVARRPIRLGVIDISANGLQVLSRDELRAGDLLELAFTLDTEVHLQARVRRVCRAERTWEAGCAFEGVPEPISEQIVRFIFVKQRELLRAARGKR